MLWRWSFHDGRTNLVSFFFEMYFWSSSCQNAGFALLFHANGLQEVHPDGRGEKEEGFGEERSTLEMGAEASLKLP